jgi:hypothetical protein
MDLFVNKSSLDFVEFLQLCGISTVGISSSSNSSLSLSSSGAIFILNKNICGGYAHHT